MTKRIISGVIAVTLLASLGLVGACTEAVQAQTGTIEVRVTDAPGDVEAIWVTVSEVKVHKAGDNEGDDGWEILTITGGSFNLLDLEELELTLAEGKEVAAGKYTQLRMTIFEVLVTLEGEDGEPSITVEATIPSGELKFVRPFELEAGGTIVLVVDFDAAESVVVTGATQSEEAKVIFKPVVKLAIQQGDKPQELTVEGTISALDIDEPDLSVSIIPTGETEAIDLIVNPQTEITLDDVEATLEELAVGQGVIAYYYLNNFKATEIHAESPSP